MTWWEWFLIAWFGWFVIAIPLAMWVGYIAEDN